MVRHRDRNDYSMFSNFKCGRPVVRFCNGGAVCGFHPLSLVIISLCSFWTAGETSGQASITQTECYIRCFIHKSIHTPVSSDRWVYVESGSVFTHTWVPEDLLLDLTSVSAISDRLVAEIIPASFSNENEGSLRVIPKIRSNGFSMLSDGSIAAQLSVEDAGHHNLFLGYVTAGGLQAAYYDNAWYAGEAKYTAVDSNVNFVWGDGVLFHDARNYVGVRWCGYLSPVDFFAEGIDSIDQDLEYELRVELENEDDAAQLWLNGSILIDSWDRQKSRQRCTSAKVKITSHTLSSIMLLYKHFEGQASVKLLWGSALFVMEPIPAENLFHVNPAALPQPLAVGAGPMVGGSGNLQLLGEGISVMTAGQTSLLRIAAKDSFGNPGIVPSQSQILAALLQTSTAAHSWAPQNLAKSAVVLRENARGDHEDLLRFERAGPGQLEVSLVDAGGLSATYYNDDSLLYNAATHAGRWTGSIDTNSTGYLDNVTSKAFSEGFSVRWIGFVYATNNSDHAVFIDTSSTSERVKLWVDGMLIVDQWTSLSGSSVSGTFVPAAENGLYPIRIEYQDGLTSGRRSSPGISMKWESPAGDGTVLARTAIPGQNLYYSAILATSAISVFPALPAPTQSELVASSVATSGVLQSFTIVVRDEYGNWLTRIRERKVCFGEDDGLYGVLRQETIEVEVMLQTKAGADSTHIGSVTPLQKGQSYLDIRLGGVHIQHSPLSLSVRPGVVSRSSVVAYGDGLTLATAGVASIFTIAAKDENGNLAMTSDWQALSVHLLSSPEFQELICIRFARELSDSISEFSFMPLQEGAFSIRVQWSEDSISGSPFSLRVLSAEACGVTSFVTGAGLTISTVGQVSSFVIFSRDSFLNPPSALSWETEHATFFVTRVHPRVHPEFSPNITSSARPFFLNVSPDAPSIDILYSYTLAGSYTLEVVIARSGGLAATFYDNSSLHPNFAVESGVGFGAVDWSAQAGSFSPEWVNETQSVQYGARWTGLLDVQASDSTIFTFSSHVRSTAERVKLWVGNVLVIDQWNSLGGTAPSGTSDFPSGTGFYEIVAEYHDHRFLHNDVRGLSLQWETEGDSDGTYSIPQSIIPGSSMFSSSRVRAQQHTAIPARACSGRSNVQGSGLTLLTAGISSAVTLTVRDEFGNLIERDIPWVYGSEGMDSALTAAVDRTGQVWSTVAGTYSHVVQLMSSGGLHATYYMDLTFTTPAASGQSLGALGEIDSVLLQPAMSIQMEYFSVRWAGFVRPSHAAAYTFFSDLSEALRLVVDGQEVFDYVPGGGTDSFGICEIPAATHDQVPSSIVLEWRHATGEYAQNLDIVWSAEDGVRKAIASEELEYTLHVIDSPFSATVYPAIGCASKSVASGPGLTIATAASVSIFYIQVKDAFSNDVTTAQTTCTTSVSCASGTTMGIDVHFVPQEDGIGSVRAVDSYFTGGAWDILVLGITVSGSYQTIISFANVGGLSATYYSGDHSSGSSALPVISRTDETMQVNSSDIAAFPSNLDPTQLFSTRWTGLMVVPCPFTTCTAQTIGDYSFQFAVGSADERVRLWLDDYMVIDQWTSLGSLEPSGTFQIRGDEQMVRIRAWTKH